MKVIAIKPLLFTLLAVSGASVSAAAGFRTIDDVVAAPSAESASSETAADAHVRARGAPDAAHSFYFTRGIYSDGGGFRGGYGRWAVDYPQADQWFAGVLGRLTGIDVSPHENPIALDDPELRRFPFLYVLEVGYMSLRESEVRGLRDYILAGGFLMVDDFWGTFEWYNFEREIKRVLPEYDIVEIPLDHPIFSTFYRIDEIIQVPNIGQGRAGGPTHEKDGHVPRVLGIFDDDERLMVVINWNTDLGDAWEWAEDQYYPLMYSTYAYQMGANFVVYAMTH